MTLGQIQRRVLKGVQRRDLNDDYRSFINEAQKEIQDTRNWSWMEKDQNVTIAVGSTSARLPEGFKSLLEGNAPIGSVTTTDGTSRVLPCEILDKLQAERLHAYSGYGDYSNILSQQNVSRLPVYIDFQANAPTVNILTEATETITLAIKYYRYLPALEKDADSNVITIDWPNMLINKTKALCFESVNDDQFDTAEKLFEFYYKKAAASDTQRKRIGGPRHM